MDIDILQKLLSALSDTGLKGRVLSGESFFSVLSLKKKGKDHITTISEAEVELAKTHNMKVERNFYVDPTPEFLEALKAVKKDFTPEETNFMPRDEFKRWVDDLPMDTVSILFDVLAKSDDTPKQNGKGKKEDAKKLAIAK